MNKEKRNKNSEQGSAKIKLIIVLLVLFLMGNAGYNYIPVAYEGENLKQEMQTAVVQGMAVPPSAINDVVKGKLQRAMASNNIPPDAFVQVKQANNVVQAHVVYSKQINILPFGIFEYNYQFDHTATPTGFLLKQ